MFSGSIVALITPFTPDGEVDYVSLKKLVDFHVDAGTDAIVSVGTTGESATLTVEEHVKVVAKTVEFAEGRLPIIAGTGANATHEAVTFSRLLNNTGIAGYLSVTPYYNKPTQEGLFLHYNAIAQETDIPVILYNVPGGDDATGLEFVKLGGQGVMSVTNNIAAADMAKMMHWALDGKFDEAAIINQRLMTLHKNLFIESSPIPVKWAAHKMGLIANGDLRLPLTQLSEPARPIVAQALSEACIY